MKNTIDVDKINLLEVAYSIAKYGYEPNETTLRLCKDLAKQNLRNDLDFDYLSKIILEGKDIKAGFDFLKEIGYIKYFPQLKSLVGCRQNPAFHPEGDVWIHTMLSLNHFAKCVRGHSSDFLEDLIIGFAVLCHDFGKPLCTTINDKGRIISYGHDKLGVEPTRKFLSKLTKNSEFIEDVCSLVKHHMKIFGFYKNGLVVGKNASNTAIKRLARKVYKLDRLIKLDECDANGKTNPDDNYKLWNDAFKDKIKELNLDYFPVESIIKGRHLLELGLVPSSKFKEILDYCYESQLAGDFYKLEDGLELLKNSYLKELNFINEKNTIE